MPKTSTLQPTVFAAVFSRLQQTANNFKKQTQINSAEGRIRDPRAAYKRQRNFVNCAVEDKQCCDLGTKRQTFPFVRHYESKHCFEVDTKRQSSVVSYAIKKVNV